MDGRGYDAHIGMSALYQARAGGNRAMIINAERYLVTNPEVTIRKRPDLVAPWHRDETSRFLRSGMLDKAMDTLKLRGADDSGNEFAKPGWKLAWESQEKRKKLEKARERAKNRALEHAQSYEQLSRELSRAGIITGLRDKLNTDLIRVAQEADARFDCEAIPDRDEQMMESKERETGGERAKALEQIAQSLSLFG